MAATRNLGAAQEIRTVVITPNLVQKHHRRDATTAIAAVAVGNIVAMTGLAAGEPPHPDVMTKIGAVATVIRVVMTDPAEAEHLHRSATTGDRALNNSGNKSHDRFFCLPQMEMERLNQTS